jgi:hypothetical protein
MDDRIRELEARVRAMTVQFDGFARLFGPGADSIDKSAATLASLPAEARPYFRPLRKSIDNLQRRVAVLNAALGRLSKTLSK